MESARYCLPNNHRTTSQARFAGFLLALLNVGLLDLTNSRYAVKPLVPMKGNQGSGEKHRRHRGPDLPIRSQNRESFQQKIPYPSDAEEDFASQHADLYADEENMVDGQHVGVPHFPRRSDRARMHRVYTTTNQQRDRTREAYMKEVEAAETEREEFSEKEIEYYNHTSDGMLPRHHTALLPLARAREEPNFL